MSINKSQTYALAGVFQAAHLMRQWGLFGEAENNAFEASLSSIFKLDAPDTLSVFGDVTDLTLGLYALKKCVDKKPDLITLRYVFSLLKLGANVFDNKKLAQQLHRRLLPVISQATHLGPTHQVVIEHLSVIYQQVFLSKNLRVIVQGRQKHLKTPQIPEKIRATVLAGIRASVLWFQMGGKRWHLLFYRAGIRDEVYNIIKMNLPALLDKVDKMG